MKNLQKFIIAMVLLFSISLFAQNRAADLQYLVDVKGSSAEYERKNRGYIHIKTNKSYSDIYAN